MASIEVTSPVDTVMAVGRSTEMTAVARDEAADPVTVDVTWSSTDESTATVSESGVVSAEAAGTTTIQASTDGVTGELEIRAVDADLDAVSAALTDTYSQALTDALGSTPAQTMVGLIATCQDHIDSGHVRVLDDCLGDAPDVTGTNGTDDALLGVFSLFLEHARRELRL